MEFKWQHPEYLLLGPALFIIVLIASILFHKWRKKAWNSLGLDTAKKQLVITPFGSMRFFTRHVLLALALVFFGLALANLQMGSQKQTINRKGADVVYALDVSRSMLAEDIAPSRLEKAKLLISKSLDGLGGDRVGIIAYAGSAYPALPITTDYAAAKTALQAASPDAVPSQGTNLAAALDYAFGYFNPASPAGRFVVVLTDGEDHENLSQLPLPDFPVNILLVGLGTPNGGPIPMTKGRNGTTYKKDNNGDVVITRRDDASLSSIGSEIKAQYIDGNSTGPAVSRIASFISEGEKADISQEIAMDYDHQFTWFLLPGIFLLLLYLLLPSRVGNPFKLSSLAVLICTSLSFNSYGQGQDSLITITGEVSGSMHEYGQLMRKGIELAGQEDLTGAATAFVKATEIQPDAFEPMYNLGSTLSGLEMYEEAEGALKQAFSNAENEEQKSDALHNLGNLWFDQERYDESVKAYKQSLINNPNKKDAIYNLSRALEKMMEQEKQEQSESEDEQEKENKEDQDTEDNENKENQDSEDKENKDEQDSENEKDNTDDADEGSPKESDKNKPEEGGESEAKMTPEEIKGLLEAIQRADEKTAEKVTAKKAKGNKTSGEKDW